MRIACASDAHRAFAKEERLMDALPRVDAFCFLGDMDDDAECLELLLKAAQPHAAFFAVAGNNDPLSRRARTLEVSFGEARVMLTHGHLFRTRQAMASRAKERDCALLLYGHSHRPLDEVIDGVRVVNPGALNAGQWALIEISDALTVRLMTL